MESTTITSEKTNIRDLKQRWDELKENEPRLRAKEIAERLGVSEAELIASACDGVHVIRLNEDWEGLFQSLESLGRLMALTRNNAAVHEKMGVYRNVSFKGHAGLVLDEEIDLRVFHKRWGFGFALPVENARGTLHSFQFFDKQGDAVHKIYLKDEKKLEIYHQIAERFRADVQMPGISIAEEIEKEENVTPGEVEAEAFLTAWSELKDTHDFYPMLRKFKVGRTDALEIAQERFAWRVSAGTVRQMLDLAAEREVPIMVFVGNSGMIQIHSGPVKKIRVMDNWVNVLDPDFNLHLRQDLIRQCWIVEKPTEDGVVTSLELFDREGGQIATFFGARKPGKPELQGWREIIQDVKQMEGHE